MTKLNTKSRSTARTHEGALAPKNLEPGRDPLRDLRRSVLSTMLWEDTFYEDGQTVADRIHANAAKVDLRDILNLAVEARTQFKLRHAPLWLLIEAVRRGGDRQISDAIAAVIQRADELAEILSMYWHVNGRGKTAKVPNQLKLGIAKAFPKFDAYQLAKYNRDGDVKLRDALFLSHAKPKDAEQAAVWKQLVDGTLSAPDTWEVALSGGADKRETFTRLLTEKKLGYMALLRNLRNMSDTGVDQKLVEQAILDRKGASRVLPFRFVTAVEHAPRYASALDKAMLASIDALPELSGTTTVLVDVSASMTWGAVSKRSQLTRMQAAAALASMVKGESVRLFSFDTSVREHPHRLGMATVSALSHVGGGGTALGAAVHHVQKYAPSDRLIVLTDEQSHDRVAEPARGTRSYMVNLASYEVGIGYGNWIRLNGFSEQILRWIMAYESEF